MFPELDLRTRIALHMLQGVMAGIAWEPNGQPLPPRDATDFTLMSFQMADSFMKASGIAGVADDAKGGD